MHRSPLLASSLALLVAFLLAGPTLSAVQSGTTKADKRIGALDTDQSTGRIAFVRLDQEFVGDIWVMDADGANETNLTNTPDVNEREPAWSPREPRSRSRHQDRWSTARVGRMRSG